MYQKTYEAKSVIIHLERTDHIEQEDSRVKIRVFQNWKDLGENQESTQVRAAAGIG